MADQQAQTGSGYFARLRSSFGGGSPSQQPNTQGTQTPSSGGDNNQQQSNNQLPRNDPGSQSALSLHEKLYDPIQGEDDVAPAFKLDGTKLGEVANAQDFVQGVDPNLMASVQAGDLSKLPELLNAVARNSYRSSLEHGSTLTDKFVGARFSHSDKSFSSRVKGELTGQALSDIPGFQSPVVKQQINDIANRLRKQHPDAAPKEIAEEAQRIVVAMADELNPNRKSNGQDSYPDEETDWSKYLGA